MRSITTTITLATALMALMMGPVNAVASSEIVTAPNTWVFVQDCDSDIEGLVIPNSQVVCFPHASVSKIEQNVQLLRQVFPSDIFVFTYDLTNASTARDFQLFLRSHDSNAPIKSLGKAFIEDGYAVASNNHLVVEHEWKHVSTCSVAHDMFGDPDVSKKIGVEPWC